jgi:hypothetical protein
MGVGYIMTMQTCWELAQEWYPGRDKREWERPGQEETQKLFRKLGLVSGFWQI